MLSPPIERLILFAQKIIERSLHALELDFQFPHVVFQGQKPLFAVSGQSISGHDLQKMVDVLAEKVHYLVFLNKGLLEAFGLVDGLHLRFQMDGDGQAVLEPAVFQF